MSRSKKEGSRAAQAERLFSAQAGRLLLSFLLLTVLCLFFPGQCVDAASGTVYSCTINPCYAHPVTGEIEDAGGSSSTTTGQGMVEGCLGTSGILEVTDSGEYYLTFRLGLVDYTSQHSFGVQNVNDSGWSSVEATVTGSGSDSNGTTSDMRVQVPSESCIVRCSMYVDPMGRDVIFYFYPSDYTEGNSTDMKAEMVTETSSASGTSSSGSDSSGTSDSTQSGDSAESATEASSSGTTAASSGTGSSLQSSVTSGQSSTESDSASLNDTQGLSLSTAPDDSSDSEDEDDGGVGTLTLILAICAGITISGLILLFTGAYIVYLFRKNWARWGAGDDMFEMEDDYEEDAVFMGEGFGLADEESGVWDSEGVVREEDFEDADFLIGADSSDSVTDGQADDRRDGAGDAADWFADAADGEVDLDEEE